jgi:hypothetical protein
VWIIAGGSWSCLELPDQKDLRFCGLNCSSVVVSQTRPPGVRWNACEDINCSSIQFLSLISLVILLAPIHVSAVFPSLVPRVNSLPIARRSCLSYKRGASGWFRDIGQVPTRNFDCLSFTPLWSPSLVLHTVGVIVRRYDGCEMAVKENDGDRWSSDGVVLCLGMRQNEDAVEWWREWSRLRWPFL